MPSTTALGTKRLKFKIGTTDITLDVRDVRIERDEADDAWISFEDAANGGAYTHWLKGIAVQDPSSLTNLWGLIWDSNGATLLTKVAPYGNATASATQPHFSGSVIVAPRPQVLLGGEANPANRAAFDLEFEFEYVAKPTRDITGTF